MERNEAAKQFRLHATAAACDVRDIAERVARNGAPDRNTLAWQQIRRLAIAVEGLANALDAAGVA